MNKGFTPIIIVVIIALGIGLFLSGIYFGNNFQVTTKPIATDSPELISSPTSSPDTKENWKTYSDATYTIMYPPGWDVEPGDHMTEEYYEGDVITVYSPSDHMTMDITPVQPTFGFGGEQVIEKGEMLDIVALGKNYQSEESFRLENGLKKIYHNFQIEADRENYFILFGTGYPVNEDSTASYNDYMKYRDTMIEVLSTLEINE